MHMRPYPKHPHHAILNLEGGDEEVVHIRAFGKDMKIEIRIDESKTGMVITTPSGMYRQAIPGRGDDHGWIMRQVLGEITGKERLEQEETKL